MIIYFDEQITYIFLISTKKTQFFLYL